jgi:hypothetical protein
VDDDRILEFERALWIGEGDIYRRCLADDCVMVVPERPFLLSGEQAIEAVEHTPRWSEVDLSDLQISRAQEGLIVIGYRADARRGETRFTAYCTSTYQRIGESDWKVIQHQQTVIPPAQAQSILGDAEAA